MSKWVNCKDRMPPEGQYVFGAVYGTDVIIPQEGESIRNAVVRTATEHPRTMICQWCGEEEGWWANHGMMIIQPRFWMKINRPTPPKITVEDIFGRQE